MPVNLRAMTLTLTVAAMPPALLFVIAGGVSAHIDDHKERWIDPMYEGPGWRSGDAAAGENGGLFSVNGVELLSWVTIPEFGAGQNAMNDCWGYTAPSGRAYAIVGLSDGTGFVEITDPGSPVVVETILAPPVVQRDVKVFGHHAYIGGENSEHGIQIVDLSQIDSGTVTLVNTLVGDGSDRTHNVVIDTDSGFLYRCGGSGNGLRIYDLNADPVNPTPVGWWPDRYVHDAQVVTYTEGPYAGRQIAFCCGGFNSGWVDPGLDILDVTDKSNIIQLSRTFHNQAAYSHQGWLSEDRQRFYLSDELNEINEGISTTLHVFDVSDLTDVSVLPSVTNGGTATTHNLYTHNGLMYLANYSAGLRVFSLDDPDAPTEVAYFDTFPDNDNAGFSGMWSCYPYFESNVVIGSDRSRGLFVMRVIGVDACPSDLSGGDDVIDVNDLLQLLASWGTDGPGADIAAPFNVVDVSDLLDLLAAWGPCGD